MPLPTPIPILTNTNTNTNTRKNSEDESDYSDSESDSESDSNNSTITGDSVNSDDDEYFIRFNSNTNYDHVDYIMIGSICYKLSNNTSLTQDSEDEECNGCQHDVLVYFINGYVDQQMMDKNEINDICRLQEIDISSHDIFRHLLE